MRLPSGQGYCPSSLLRIIPPLCPTQDRLTPILWYSGPREVFAWASPCWRLGRQVPRFRAWACSTLTPPQGRMPCRPRLQIGAGTCPGTRARPRFRHRC